MIRLPRQAGDKHRGKLKKRPFSCRAFESWERPNSGRRVMCCSTKGIGVIGSCGSLREAPSRCKQQQASLRAASDANGDDANAYDADDANDDARGAHAVLRVLGITRRMTGAVARLSHGTPRQLWASSASSLTSLAMRYVPQVQCRHHYYLTHR